MLLLNLPIQQIYLFFFVLIRVGTILFVVPFLSSSNVPVLVKVGLAVSVSWLMLPQIQSLPPALDTAPIYLLALGVVSEIAIGLIIGLMVQLLFVGIQLAGQMAGYQMGLALANVVDPASSMQIPMLAQFLNLFALLIFLCLDIHHYFIRALVDGFDTIPFWGARFEGDLLALVVNMAGKSFSIAVQVAAPVMAALLLTSVALGLIARTVPQMQIFVVAMPLKIILGLLFLGFSLPFCMNYLRHTFAEFGQTILGVIRILL